MTSRLLLLSHQHAQRQSVRNAIGLSTFVQHLFACCAFRGDWIKWAWFCLLVYALPLQYTSTCTQLQLRACMRWLAAFFIPFLITPGIFCSFRFAHLHLHDVFMLSHRIRMFFFRPNNWISTQNEAKWNGSAIVGVCLFCQYFRCSFIVIQIQLNCINDWIWW